MDNDEIRLHARSRDICYARYRRLSAELNEAKLTGNALQLEVLRLVSIANERSVDL